MTTNNSIIPHNNADKDNTVDKVDTNKLTDSESNVKSDKTKTNNKNDKKKVKHYNILQMNKGTSDFKLKQDLISHNMKDNKVNMALVTEANHDYNDPIKIASLKKVFKGYNVEVSKQTNNDKIGVSCL